MELLLNINLKKQAELIGYRDKILLTGSCFTEHIGNALTGLKFDVLQNPNGILFGPDAVCKSLLSYKENKKYTGQELFCLNEVWNSWDHHSRFSHIDKTQCLDNINRSQQQAHDFLRDAGWLIITLGSAFTYELTAAAHTATENISNSVANCHRAPARWFHKKMLDIEVISRKMEECLKELKQFNPGLRFLFTISPVRHIRDGVVENNRSKARLIEAVHDLVTRFESAYYFPAYELLIDVLRDYRFYDIDLVHPNYAGTEFILEKFTDTCIDEESQLLMKEIKTIVTARKHRAFQPYTNAHKQFLHSNLDRVKRLKENYPFLNLAEEIKYFTKA